jgi:transcriptional regulator with XRE-family HTH domain
MKHLNALRIDAGYSILDIARLLNVDDVTACRWLSGISVPDDDQKQQLAELLNVSPADLEDDRSIETPGRVARYRQKISMA